MNQSFAGPSWIGIGAQRSGTTWFTDLLLQHPEVSLPTSGRKELHSLSRSLMGNVDPTAYQDEFRVAHKAGEWTPFYLRAAWVPQVALSVTGPHVPFLVLLRDPVERFASAMRLESQPARIKNQAVAERLLGSDAIWAGMYATHLEMWESWVGRERLMVMQYESVVRDPQPFVDQVWKAIGLDPIGLKHTDRRSRTSTDGGWDLPDDLRWTLRNAYAPEVNRLERWGICREEWSNFSDTRL